MDTQTMEKVSPLAGVHPTRLFTGSCFALISTAVCFSIVTSLVPQLKTAFGLDNEQAGWIVGASIWGFTISIFVLGPLCDALGMRRLLRLAFVLHFMGVLLMIYTDKLGPLIGSTFGVLFTGALIVSMGNGIVEAVCNPLVATIYPERKTVMLNRFHMWFPGGIVIGGLIAYGIDALGEKFWAAIPAGTGNDLAAWQVKMAVVLLPTVIYGLLFARQKFPVTERVQSGVSFGGMVKATLCRPLFIVLFFCMMITASLELGPNRWMGQAMTDAMKFAGPNAGILVLVWISGLMAILRLLAGPVVHRLSPTGILLASAVLGGLGLYSLTYAAQSNNPYYVGIAATIFACGVCYFWPCMLGVAAERVPKGGALALGLLGGTGMAVVGLVAVPLMGLIADRHVSQSLEPQKVQSCLVAAALDLSSLQQSQTNSKDTQASITQAIAATTAAIEADPVANKTPAAMKKATAALRETIKAIPDSPAGKEAKELIGPADTEGNLISFRVVSSFAIILVVIFGILYIRDRKAGGYKIEKI